MNATFNKTLPALSNEGGLPAYLDQIKKFPMLAAEEEYMLAKNWKATGNIKSAEKLVTSHLRLVAKIAMGYRGYGLPVSDMVAEGNIGLMQAVKKFNPEKGFKLANADMVIVAQKPKLASHLPEMKENFASALDIETGQINIKATTTEKLGFAGREEGIAAYAVALLIKND